MRPPPLHNNRPIGGANVDVSHVGGAQYEARVAADPENPQLLLAASIDGSDDARVYTSRDGGASWRGAIAPPVLRGLCGLSHPAVAIGPGHLQVYASLVTDTCQPPDPHLYVATRHGSARRWAVREIAPMRGFWFDQRPVVAVDVRGRIAVAWTRLRGEIRSRQELLVATSDDGGRWSTPRRIPGYGGVYSVDLAAGHSGDLYLAVADGRGHALDLLRSTDGGRRWGDRRQLARLLEPYVVGCGPGAVSVPAQPQRCIGPSPSIAVGRAGTIAVVYSEPEANETQGVYVVHADRSLHSSSRPRRVAPRTRIDRISSSRSPRTTGRQATSGRVTTTPPATSAGGVSGSRARGRTTAARTGHRPCAPPRNHRPRRRRRVTRSATARPRGSWPQAESHIRCGPIPSGPSMPTRRSIRRRSRPGRLPRPPSARPSAALRGGGHGRWSASRSRARRRCRATRRARPGRPLQ